MGGGGHPSTTNNRGPMVSHLKEKRMGLGNLDEKVIQQRAARTNAVLF